MNRLKVEERIKRIAEDIEKLEAPNVKEAYDTSTEEFYRFVENVEGAIGENYSAELIDKLDKEFRSRENPNGFVSVRLALKLIRSKRFVESGDYEKTTVFVLYPVYKEKNRMTQRSQGNPHGEYALIHRIERYKRLEELSKGKFDIWVIVVEDGCPESSGDLAKDQISENFPKDMNNGKYRVIKLDKKEGRESIKGGAIKKGTLEVADILDEESREFERVVVLDSDADLSIHPDILGLGLEAMQGKSVVIGSRRQEDSVAFIGEKRNSRGILYIAIIQKLLSGIAEIGLLDTNRAFKLYDFEVAKKNTTKQQILQFPYQIEAILSSLQITEVDQVVPLGVSYIDSEALSTATTVASYYSQVIQIVGLSDRFYGEEFQEDLKSFLRETRECGWNELENSVPQELLNVPLEDLKDFDLLEVLSK